MVAEHPGRRRPNGIGGLQRLGDDRAQVRCAPRRHEVGEVERLVQLVRSQIAGQPVGRLDPGFGDEHPVAVVLVDDPAPRAVDLVHAVLVPVRRARPVLLGAVQQLVLCPVGRQPGGLDQAVRDVDAEPRHASVEPKPQDRLELLVYLRVRPVQVRLLDVEQVQVPLAGPAVGFGDPLPGAAAENRLPVVRRLVANAVEEHVTVAFGTARDGRQRSTKPFVLVRGVVRHQVDDHPQT